MARTINLIASTVALIFFILVSKQSGLGIGILSTVGLSAIYGWFKPIALMLFYRAVEILHSHDKM